MFPDNDAQFQEVKAKVAAFPASMIVMDSLLALRAAAQALLALKLASSPDSALHKQVDDIERVMLALIKNQFEPLTEMVTKDPAKAVKDYA